MVTLAILAGCLCVSFAWRNRSEMRKRLTEWPRRREDRSRCRAFLRQSPQTGFDASSISPRIEQLRHAHVSAAHARFQHHHTFRGLLMAARRAVTRLDYFRSVEPQTSDSAEHEQKYGSNKNHPMKKSIALLFAASTFFLAGCCTTPHATKWEYIVADGPPPHLGPNFNPQEFREGTQRFLNDLGKDGWVLVSVSEGRVFYFKRPIK